MNDETRLLIADIIRMLLIGILSITLGFAIGMFIKHPEPSSIPCQLPESEPTKNLEDQNLVGSSPDEKDDHIFECHEMIRNLKKRIKNALE